MKKFHFKKLTALLLVLCITFAGRETVIAETVGTSTAASSASSVFSPPDLSEYTLWNGTDSFKNNTKYYITESVKIREDASFVLPAGSTLYLAENSSLRVYVGGALDLYGTLITAPRSNFTTSGKFTAKAGSSIKNYGTFITTPSSTTDLMSAFTSYDTSTTVFCGTTNIYKDSKFNNYGRATLSKDSTMTVTGIVRSFEEGRFVIDGKMQITLSGRFAVAGILSLTGTGSLITSGTLTIEKTASFRKEQGALLAKMKSGRYDDYRAEPLMIVKDDIIGGIKGIDVSYWQGVIDWKKVASSGVKFAIIRSSYSDDTVDKMFTYNITEAIKAGIHVGVYHYCYALDEEEAREEARFFIETISPYEIDFPVMFDFEDPCQVKLGKEKLTRIAEAFMEEIENAGYYPMIYSYKNWLNSNLDMDRLSKYETAVAEWDVAQSTYDRPYGVWQYSCKGLVSGIEGDVDLDICYKDFPSIIRKGGWNHLTELDETEDDEQSE